MLSSVLTQLKRYFLIFCVITLMGLGEVSAWEAGLDSGEHQIEAQIYTFPQHERVIAPLLMEDPNIRAWAVSSGIKVMPGAKVCARSSERQRLSSDQLDIEPLRIDTARNEAESAQVVFRVESAQESVAIRFGELVSLHGDVLPADAVTAHWVGHVPVTIPSSLMSQFAAQGSPDTEGMWPDPLLPMSEANNLVPNTNYVIWITAKPGKDTPAGLYGGFMSLQFGGAGSIIPIEVQVFDFTLPDRMDCETAFGFDSALAYTYHNARTEEEQRKVLDMYLELLSLHHISPYNPAPLDPFVVHWPDPADLEPVSVALSIDWARWDAAIGCALNEFHFNTFRLPSVGLGGGSFHSRHDPELLGFGEGTPEYKTLFNAYWGAVEAHLKEKGWLEEAFIYWFDEPDPKDYEFVNNGFIKLKNAAPGIRRMLTEQVEEQLIGGPNLWCPVSPAFREKSAVSRRTEGEQFWWYICTWPKAPFATLFIDQPATALRAWLWQTWEREIEGILIWQTNYWTSAAAYPDSLQNPYVDPMSWVSGYSTPSGVRKPWGNGDGRFFYPPRVAAEQGTKNFISDPPNPSIRLAMLRDGIEDYQYLVLLRELLESPKAVQLRESERSHLELLLEAPASVSSRLTSFTPSPEPIMDRRKRIAQAIETLSRR